jgi:beta-lactamase superfamily II metal-dependent hydrolase
MATFSGTPTISKSMATAKSRVQYSVMTLVKIATDTWILTGDAATS